VRKWTVDGEKSGGQRLSQLLYSRRGRRSEQSVSRLLATRFDHVWRRLLLLLVVAHHLTLRLLRCQCIVNLTCQPVLLSTLVGLHVVTLIGAQWKIVNGGHFFRRWGGEGVAKFVSSPLNYVAAGSSVRIDFRSGIGHIQLFQRRRIFGIVVVFHPAAASASSSSSSALGTCYAHGLAPFSGISFLRSQVNRLSPSSISGLGRSIARAIDGHRIPGILATSNSIGGKTILTHSINFERRLSVS
jgi:hypothetical protein